MVDAAICAPLRRIQNPTGDRHGPNTPHRRLTISKGERIMRTHKTAVAAVRRTKRAAASLTTAVAMTAGLVGVAAPASAATEPAGTVSTATTWEIVEPGSASGIATERQGSTPTFTVAAAGWHRLWGPVGVWTDHNGGWLSNSFHSRSSTLGVNFRCWWWRGSDTMWASITDGSGQIVARSRNMLCDGHWKTLIYRHAHRNTKYHMAIHLNPRGRNLAEVKAYDYW
ncbi:hypothetical protein ACFFWC_23395 [Plantactinospora siamensis]|uniref:Uncharacterized protein n=1 Tax=Plantactinospora siamensis TaxID=555372 RepID=A0ABV6NWF6_9ACTN